jgi:integrase
MRKTQLRITKAKVRRGKAWDRYYCVVVPKLGGGRTRRFFKFDEEGKQEAETFLDISKTQQQNYGTAALSLSPHQRAEYLWCCDALKPYDCTLREAVAFIMPHLKARNRTCTVKDLIAEISKVKKADGSSARYLEDIESRLGQFEQVFGSKNVSAVHSKEVDDWLRSLSVAATTRNNFRRVLIVAFNFAKQRGYCIDNPAKQSAKAKEIESPVGILSVNQLSRLIAECDEILLPFLTIGAFAGLRRAELERLDWSEVDLQSGLIEVTARKAKSARRRFVKIKANLSEWLRSIAKSEGKVTPANYRKLLDEARAKAEIKDWPQNALRHSFASYHLAHFQDAAALALEMGHASSGLVFQHYREVVKPKEAARYWEIKPASAENVVAMTA